MRSKCTSRPLNACAIRARHSSLHPSLHAFAGAAAGVMAGATALRAMVLVLAGFSPVSPAPLLVALVRHLVAVASVAATLHFTLPFVSLVILLTRTMIGLRPAAPFGIGSVVPLSLRGPHRLRCGRGHSQLKLLGRVVGDRVGTCYVWRDIRIS